MNIRVKRPERYYPRIEIRSTCSILDIFVPEFGTQEQYQTIMDLIEISLFESYDADNFVQRVVLPTGWEITEIAGRFNRHFGATHIVEKID